MEGSLDEEQSHGTQSTGNGVSGSSGDDDLELIRGADTKVVARLAAERIAEHARLAVAERGTFSLAVSGGKSHWLMLAMLASVIDMPWQQTELFQVDERIASPGSPERNLTHLILTLPIEKQASLRPMPVTRRDMPEAAAEYAAELPETFDVVHLGLGPAGEVASLGSSAPSFETEDRRVALTEPNDGSFRRMTLTLQAINEARSIVWLITGEDRHAAYTRLLDGDRSIPAGRVRRRGCCVVADASASGQASTSFAADLWRGPPEA